MQYLDYLLAVWQTCEKYLLLLARFWINVNAIPFNAIVQLRKKVKMMLINKHATTIMRNYCLPKPELLEPRQMLSWTTVGDASVNGNTIRMATNSQNAAEQSNQTIGWRGAWACVRPSSSSLSFSRNLFTWDTQPYDHFNVAFANRPLSVGGTPNSGSFKWGGQVAYGDGILEQLSGEGSIPTIGSAIQILNVMLYTGVDTKYPSWGDITLDPDDVRLSSCIDLAIDSNNNGVIERDDDDVEDVSGDDSKPGKIVHVANFDSDGDGILDFVDGFDWRQGPKDDVVNTLKFVPIELTIPDFIRNLPGVRIEISYNESNPQYYKTAHDAGMPGVHFQRPVDGKLRLWKKNGDVSRDLRPVAQGGDFINSGQHSLQEVGVISDKTTLYIEAVNPSVTTADLTITARLIGGGLQGDHSDKVRVTSTLMEVFQKSEVNGMDDFETYGALIAARIAEVDSTGEEHVNGYLPTYYVRVHDPRSNLSTLQISTRRFPLIRSGSYYTTLPFTVARRADIAKIAANAIVNLDYDFNRNWRYVGFFEPNHEFANPEPWSVIGSASITANPTTGILSVNTVGGSVYYAQTTNPFVAQRNVDFTLNFRIRVTSIDSQAIGAFAVVVGTGTRVFYTIVSRDSIRVFSGNGFLTGQMPNIIDGAFHDIILRYFAGPRSMEVFVDGQSVIGSLGQQSTYVGLLWGDLSTTSIGGIVEYAHVDFTAGTVDAPTEYSERPRDLFPSFGSMLLLADGEKPEFSYNPDQKGSPLVFSDSADGADKQIAKWVEEAVDELEGTFTPIDPTDAGAFGKALSAKVREKINGLWWGRSQWKTGVLIELGSKQIKAFGANKGIGDQVEVDIMYFEKGYNPRVGEILDPNRVIVYELKASISGQMDPNQLSRLAAIAGGPDKVKRIWSRLHYSLNTQSLVENKRYARQRDVFNQLGLKSINPTLTTVGLIVGFATVDSAWADFEREVLAMRNMTNPVDIALQEAVVVNKLKDFLEAASGGTMGSSADILLLGYIYKRLIPRMADPHWQGSADD